MSKRNRLYVGVTTNNELYFLETEPMSEGHDYFSMSGTTLRLLESETAEREARERLEDGEEWRMAVEAGRTEQSKDDWVDEVLNIDGWEGMHDIDCNIGQLSIDDKEYYFEWSACGQHEETEFKKMFISKSLFDALMAAWRAYHLKKETPALPPLPAQDEQTIAKEAAEFIRDAENE